MLKRLCRVLLAVMAVAALGVSGPARAQTKVLFDGAHGQMLGNADWTLDEDSCGTPQRLPNPSQTGISASTPETYWNGAFSAFGVNAVKKGYWVESLPPGVRITYGDSSNAQDLGKYKVFVIPEPNVRFTSAEKTAIINFVRNGGGLFMIADHWNSDRNSDGWDSPEIFNDLMASVSWGLRFQVENEPDNWFNDNPNSNYTRDTASPIIRGVYGTASSGKGLGLYGATSMTLNPTANPSVRGHVWMTTGTAGANTKVTFATSTDGLGRIAAIGDSSPGEDATNSCGHKTYNGFENASFDNGLIHLNAIAWLAGGGGGGSDTTAPSAPTNLAATVRSSSQVDLAWTASTDNVGVASYTVYRGTDGTTFSAVASTNTPAHADTGLAASTTYSYRVRARDAAGNESAASNTVSGTTQASSSPAKVILNEILANEPGTNTAGEFVEVVNVGGTSIDISGWSIWDSGARRHTFASGTVLGAGKALAVFGAASGIPSGTPNALGSSTGGLGLANGGDTVSVRNAAGTTVNSFTYSSSLASTDGVSMNRGPDTSATGGFVLHTSLSSLSSSAGKKANGTAF